jgi:outer membrane protein assembly factor BamB
MTRVGLAIAILLAACGDNNDECSSWRQWGNSSSHEGASCVTGQTLGSAALVDVAIDPFIPQEVIDGDGDLFVHYQSPLVDGDQVFLMAKSGTYTPCDTDPDGQPDCFGAITYRLSSQVWQENAYAWQLDGSFQMIWSFDSDWKPEPNVQFEPMFQPALDGDLVVVPGLGGAIWELSRDDGSTVQHVEPFQTLNPDIYVAGGLAVGGDGTIYYSALQLDHDNPYGMPPMAWFVAVAPDGTSRTVPYSQLVTGAPGPNDPCFYSFDPDLVSLPWPPDPLQLPSQYACGAQRPGMNAAPAIGADGTIFIVSRAHYNEQYAYVVALNPDLTTKWATSLRGMLEDGCGVTIPSDGTPIANIDDCRVGAPKGVDPSTGMSPAAAVDDDSSASPVALPDGGVLYGAFTSYNDYRGHLIKLDANGKLAGTFDFGWDDTPAIVPSDGDYKIVTKDNHYNESEYGVDLGPYFITELDSSLQIKWQFRSTNTQSCERQSDGTIACTSDHPYGFEWCIDAPAVDRNGAVYVNSEDGTAYAISPDGTLQGSTFLDKAEGAAYTPVVLDHAGRVYAINNGHVQVLGE